MNAVRIIHDVVGLNRSLLFCGVSKTAWYYTSKPRDVSPDPEILDTVQKIAPARPTYGTRRMAAQISRELNRPVNRKAIRRIFKRLGWSKPSSTKQEIIRANKQPPRLRTASSFTDLNLMPTLQFCNRVRKVPETCQE